MKFRATFTQRGDEICGTISSEGDALFMLECLASIVQEVASKSGVPPAEVVQDLYSVVLNKVTQ